MDRKEIDVNVVVQRRDAFLTSRFEFARHASGGCHMRKVLFQLTLSHIWYVCMHNTNNTLAETVKRR